MEEMEIKDIFAMLYHKLALIIVITLIVTFFGSVYTAFLLKPLYSASTTIILTSPTDVNSTSSDISTITQSDILLNQKLVATYGEIIKSKKVANLVIAELNLGITPENLVNDITVSSKKDTAMIEISISYSDAETAAKIANSVASVFAKEIVTIYNISNVSIIDKAELNPTPYNINIAKQIIMFFFIGVAFGIAIAFLISYLDTTVKTPDDVEKKLKIPVIAVIPLNEDK